MVQPSHESTACRAGIDSESSGSSYEGGPYREDGSVHELKKAVCEKIGDASHWVELSDRIHANPETNFEEFKASGWLAGELRTLGFEVETGVGGIATAFRATLDSGTPGPSVGFIMEYDALEGMGHACGHNTKVRLRSAA